MSPTIMKFTTLDDEDIIITSEDAKHIALESRTFALILSGQLQVDVLQEQKYGREAIRLAVEYCKKFGEIQHSCARCSELFETKCKEVQPWADDFIDHITKKDLGMVHELLAVSRKMLAFRLCGLTCQRIFDELCFKDYSKFREAFAFQFLFPPCFINDRDIQKVEAVLDELECSTLEEILTVFKDKFPFTPVELGLAKSENESLRVDGKLKYKIDNRSIEDLLIKIEYIERRLISFEMFSIWVASTLSNCYTEYDAHLEKDFDDQSNNDIGRMCSARPVIADSICDRIRNHLALVNRLANQKDTGVIKDKMAETEFRLAQEANTHKKEAVETFKGHLENGKSRHGDKMFPCLTIYLERYYHEIHSAFCYLRGWMSPREVQHKISMLANMSLFGNMEDKTKDQGMDVQSEVQPLGSQKTIDDELKEVKGNELKELTDNIVSSLRKLQSFAISTLYGDWDEIRSFYDLQTAMLDLLHIELLIKDEEILAFICKRKFQFYMEASERGASTLTFADDKEEFDRIMKETDEKFGDRGPDVEEAKKKYILYYSKFHNAMVDETKHQKFLFDAYGGQGNHRTEKESMEVEKESLQVEEGRQKRMRTAATTSSCHFTDALNVHY